MKDKCLCNNCSNNLRTAIKIFAFLTDCIFDHLDKKESNIYFTLYAAAADQFAYLIKKKWTLEEIENEIVKMNNDIKKLTEQEQKIIKENLINLIQEAGKDPVIED